MAGAEGLPQRWDSGEARSLADRAYRGDEEARAQLGEMLASSDDAKALDALYEWSGIKDFVPLPQFDDKKRPLPPDDEWGTPGTGDGQGQV